MAARINWKKLATGLVLLMAGGLFSFVHAQQPDIITVPFGQQHEAQIEVYTSSAPRATLIWHPHEVGIQAVDQQLAADLAKRGIDVWLVDLLESSFLPNTTNNMDRLSGDGFAALIRAAQSKRRPVIIASSGRGAIPLLRGARQWQLANPDDTTLAGAILISPKLYVETPQPGKKAEFMPVTLATNLPIVILQPNKSPWFWKLTDTIAALQQGGSDVYLWPLNELRDRFYFRPDANDYEVSQTRTLANKLHTAANLLTRLTPAPRRAVADIKADPKVREGKPDRSLAQFQGDPQPPPLALPDLQGRIIDLRDLHGQVVLVNFWASWCPPCVHEMPSMQRLMDQMQGKPFTILGVNMAEDEQTIRQFLTTRVNVRFPIVLDKDGHALKQWGVFAFPTSYVIDKQGKIRYALFGSVEWDEPSIVEKITALVNAR